MVGETGYKDVVIPQLSSEPGHVWPHFNSLEQHPCHLGLLCKLPPNFEMGLVTVEANCLA